MNPQPAPTTVPEASDARDDRFRRDIFIGPDLRRDHYRSGSDRIVANVLYFLPWLIVLTGIGQVMGSGPLNGVQLLLAFAFGLACARLASLADAVVLRRYCVYGDQAA